ncbi:DUF2214 domain-containing protein [Bauldia sp.]|uniref:DUF2214 domain-containing protein n=1 Tax=Bauldia sp. TaxID=2575872 RepID=UPI003BADB40E
MEALLTAIGSSDIAAFIRASRWVYPFVNAAHILGIALVVGTIIALDVRIFGFGRSITVTAAARFLMPFTITGLVLTIVAGILLFSVKPPEYAANPMFRLKLVLLLLALVNATLLRRRALHHDAPDTIMKVGAVTSLILWTGVLVSGRMIAFVG